MLNRFIKIFQFLALLCPSICFADYGGWDYYGSGRDHPYSAYIDRKNYVGYADYAPIAPGYISGPLSVTSPVITSNPTTPPPITIPEEFTVNIPNSRGGFNAVVIKKAGDGFIGPDGEYYPEFPKTFQLQMKYGQ